MSKSGRKSFGAALYFAGALFLGLYFAYSAIQGDFGVLRQMEVTAERTQLQQELDALHEQVVEMENLTLRLSDKYLDLDLLDQQARDVLGLIRADEIIIR